MRSFILPTVGALVLTIGAHAAFAVPEICGNGIDDNTNGYADDGCASNAAMKICESPMSCKLTGDIAPKTGGLVYRLPADVNPAVPFGPSLSFVRTYASLYSPPATNYRTAMGARWQHNFQSWITKSGSTAIVHMIDGRDVLFNFSVTSGGFDYYTGQAGYYVGTNATGGYLRQATASPNNWELRMLTGEKYVYNWASPTGKLIELDDSLATPNKVLIVYFTSGTDNGQINTITDASAHKRLSFVYTSGRISQINFQTGSGTWTTRVSLNYTYSGTNLTVFKIGTTTIQTNSYNASNYLTAVQDGSSNHVADFAWVGTTGQTARVTVGAGGIGFDYNSTNSQCTGQTVEFFNIANTISCSTDTDCSGQLLYKCGGKTGTGATGKCYRAARCLTTTSPNEDLITTVSAITPCTGACAPTAQYSWDTSTGKINLKGIKRATNFWTSFARDSNGMVTTMAEGDTDDDPTNSGGVKTFYLYGNTSFPGRATEMRRRSNIEPFGLACDLANTSGCKRTRSTWNTDGLLGSREEDGYTIDATNNSTTFANTTNYFYDTKGRLTQIDGPLSGSNDVTNYSYWSSSDVFKDGYLNLTQRKKDSTNFVTTTLDGYDYFGNAGSTQDPDGTFTCRTWDANQNYISQSREAMNGQTSCTTSNSLDLTTSFVRDTWLRLTKTTLPLGDCQHKEYDSSGRATNTKLRDDCVATNAGNTMVQTHDSNGLNSKTEFQDSSSIVTQRLQGTYLDGMQVDGIANPVSTYSRNFTYYTDAQQDFVTFENGLGKTEQVRDAQNRATGTHRFTDTTNHLDWTLGYPASSPSHLANKVTDPASKQVATDYDDLNRKNRTVSPDSGTTLRVFDAASRMTTMIEGYGSADQVTHTFSYDNMGRTLTEDYGSEGCSGSNPIEIQYTYDALPSGVTCPTGATCTNLSGRLAYVKDVLMCTSASPFHLDQQTLYGYDAAGRVISEEIDDPSPRAAQQNYTWDKNGNLTQVTGPSQVSMTYTFGSAGSNSDANLISTLARTVSGTPTNLLTGILWTSFGPVSQYDQANTIGGNKIRATLAWNLAYRANKIDYAAIGGAANRTHIDYAEDEKGRYTQKLYSNVTSGVLSDYLQYDWYDRPTCDATVSGTCPSSGSTLKTNVSAPAAPGYNSSNDRVSFYHQDPSYGSFLYSITQNSGTDQINNFTQSGVSGSTTFGWDGRGNRTFDDDSNTTNDRRDYTYEGRRRVRTITGQYRTLCGGFPLFFPCGKPYVITYAYDHRDRMVFRSFRDTSSFPFESQTFYYYDLNDSLIEDKVIPDVSSPGTYTVYQFYWLEKRPVAEWATDNLGSTARYFIHADEANRPLEVFDWPSSGDAANVWSLNPEIFGWDQQVAGNIYQPLRMNGTIIEDASVAYNDIVTPTLDRPPLLMVHGTHFDPMTETILQPLGTWPNESYGLGSHSPATELTELALSVPTADPNPLPTSWSPPSGPPPPSFWSPTFPGDKYLNGNGCFGTANYSDDRCGECVHKCSLQSGTQDFATYRLCYDHGLCHQSDIVYLNICKAQLGCGADPSQPQLDFYNMGPVCEVVCGFKQPPDLLPFFVKHTLGISPQ